MKGQGEGLLAGFAIAMLLVITLAAVLHGGREDEQKSYLRRHVLHTGAYVPCRDKWFDSAMGVDCGPMFHGLDSEVRK